MALPTPSSLLKIVVTVAVGTTPADSDATRVASVVYTRRVDDVYEVTGNIVVVVTMRAAAPDMQKLAASMIASEVRIV